MHHLLANRSTGCEAVECSGKNEISGQPNGVAQSFFVSKNDCDLALSLRLPSGESIGGGRSTVDGIPVGISERVSV